MSKGKRNIRIGIPEIAAMGNVPEMVIYDIMVKGSEQTGFSHKRILESLYRNLESGLTTITPEKNGTYRVNCHLPTTNGCNS